MYLSSNFIVEHYTSILSRAIDAAVNHTENQTQCGYRDTHKMKQTKYSASFKWLEDKIRVKTHKNWSKR